MGSLETKRIYEINVPRWEVLRETAAPGTPWGMTAMGDEFRVLCGETDDDRFIRRYVPGKGFDAKFCIPCPDNSGSQLGYDGRRLHLSQWYPRKVLALGADGSVERVISVAHGICGQVFVDGLMPHGFVANFLTFEGRIGRLSYFLRSLFTIIIVGTAAAAIAPFNSEISAIVYCLLIYLLLANTGKRLHDMNSTHWLSVGIFIPLVGLILMLVPGDKGRNDYGDAP
jgi:uncharacterized membrane protein YhaH (DUF805 family)